VCPQSSRRHRRPRHRSLTRKGRPRIRTLGAGRLWATPWPWLGGNRWPATDEGWETRRAGVLTARDRQVDDVSTHRLARSNTVLSKQIVIDCHHPARARFWVAASVASWSAATTVAASRTSRLGPAWRGARRVVFAGGVAVAASTDVALVRRPPSPVGQGGGGHRRWRTEKTAPSGSLSTAMRPTSARSNGATDTEPPS
jgi:hypothetical protein